LSPDEKEVFKTAYEIDQKWLIEHAGDRTPYICQAQSLKLFLPAAIHKRDLHRLHWDAWKKGVKSLYHCHAKPAARAKSDISAGATHAAARPASAPQGFRDPELGDDRSIVPPAFAPAEQFIEAEQTDFVQKPASESAQILTKGAWKDAFLDDLFSR
jgi:hypothetical protein